jgi:uncharacterized membrane protein
MAKMTSAALERTLVLSAITGMRTMAGPATLAVQHGGTLKRVVGLMAAAEMVADKTTLVGDRIDAAPLAGRAVMGAVVGGVIAREEHGSVLLGGMLGASVAVITAHLAYHARKRLPVSTALGGVLEDSIVVGLGALYASRARA